MKKTSFFVLRIKLAFVSTLLKDIRLERARITEKDKLRLLFVTKFFLAYFLAFRHQSQTDKAISNEDEDEEKKWPFGLIAEVMERDWIVWVLKRMREAVDETVKRNNPFSFSIYLPLISLNCGTSFKPASNV